MGNKSDNKQGKSTSAMKQLLPLVAAGIVAVIAATGCLYAYQASQLQPEQQNAQARLLAQSLASQASNTIQTSRQQLDILSDRSDVNKALSDGNLSSFNVHQNQWLPDATVQLVPRRGADTAQFSYTAQELLKNVRLGQEIGRAHV